MAGFKTHITTSCVLGVGYTGAGIYLGLPIESSLIAGGLCGIGGMLPDIDSDSGVPFRESMGFAAACVPALLMGRLQQVGLNYEQLILVSGALYLFVRFGVGRLLSRYTVHRGMFHSLPASVLFAGLAFLLCGSSSLNLRYFVAGGVWLGVMSHLVLDEIYAVEWKGGRWRFKSSFGTALKLWGKSAWGNISVYGKLAIVVLMILGEPMVMDQYGQLSPVVIQRDQWSKPLVAANTDPTLPVEQPVTPEQLAAQPPRWQPLTAQTPLVLPENPAGDRTIYDTARRIWRSWKGDQAER